MNGNTVTVSDLTIAKSGDRELFVAGQRIYVPKESKTKRSTDYKVQCQTPEYTFELKRDSASSAYTIANYSARRQGDATLVDEVVRKIAQCSTGFDGRSLMARMQSSTFVVRSVKSFDDSGVEIVRIGYSWSEKKHSETGTIDLVPSRGWVIRGVEIKIEAQVSSAVDEVTPQKVMLTRKDDVLYRDFGGSQFPFHFETSIGGPLPGVYQTIVIDLTEINVGPISPDVFKLSHFGLPDVPLRPVRQVSAFSVNSPWLWVSFATAVLSFVMLWIMRGRSGKVTALGRS